MAKKKLFVNVYEIARCYGGPEEGGWYYDCGDVVESFPVKRGKQAKRLQRQLQKDCKKIIGRRRANCEVVIEKNPGSEFPKRRPHYE